MGVYDNVMTVKEGMANAAVAAGRSLDKITLVAVSKTFDAPLINEAVKAGVYDIGENYVQEFLAKVSGIDKNAKIHFIGHLQSNKVKSIMGKVQCIQSCDRVSLAKEINKHAEKIGVVQNVLIEVNAAGEAAKSGVNISNAVEVALEIAELQNIRVCGLMSIPPHFNNPASTRPYFERLYNLFLDIESKKTDNSNIKMSVLSMGMSGDYKEAIKCGSTMVRVGTAIFGQRNYNNV